MERQHEEINTDKLIHEALPSLLGAPIGITDEHRPFNPEHDLPWITTGEVVSILSLLWFAICFLTDRVLLSPATASHSTFVAAMRSIMPGQAWGVTLFAVATAEWSFLYFDVPSWMRRSITSICFGWWLFLAFATFSTQWNSLGVGLFGALAYAITPRLRWG